MSAFWEQVGGCLERGERVFVACVAESTRGSPGTAGAKLLVAEGGELYGTVGGGLMEHRLVEQARELLRGGGARPEKRTLVHSDTTEGEQSGMVCEGSQTNVFCVLADDGDRAIVDALATAVRDDRPAWMAVDAEGLRLVEREADFSRPPFALTGEGESWRYEEDLLNRRRLAVIGGGHCAVALAEAMAPLGYRSRIFDTRTEVVTHDRAARVGTVIHVADYAEAGPLIAWPELTAVVVMTADYRTDVRALLGTADLPVAFVGLMGGRRKVARIFGHLREEGVSQEVLDQVHAPVGLDIGSDTPEEIAVSVAAQILRERNRG
ncbi:MAG: XdhC family protein [Spirochaetaceae bacterium]|nr:XdhC family protein [Spirochaetaceae bacterium]